MASNNQIIVIGRVANAASEEVKHLSNGSTVAEIRLAVPRHGKAAGQEITDWIACKFWDRQAEILSDYVNKGDLLSVTGSLRVDHWETPEGNRRQRYYIQAENFQMLGSRRRPKNTDNSPEKSAEKSELVAAA
jgi:single-strand DNA-binding protein